MKRSEVRPGVRAMLSLAGRKGAVAVLVRYQHRPERAGDVRWACLRESDGQYYTATPRQLQPMPVTLV